MIEKYHMRRDDTGDEYVRSCDIAHLEARKVGKGPIKLGTKFLCISKLDGSTYKETLTGVGKKGRAATTRTWIKRDDQLGINPDQYEQAMAADARLGVPIEYDRNTGQAIFRSPGQYRRYAETHGFYSLTGKGGSYSDPQKLDAREREIRGLPPVAYLAENTDYE